MYHAYWNTSPELVDFLQAIAELIARYKDGSKSGTHTVTYKNCYTAPPSLTNALISALGAATELFAAPFDFNPKMKHFSAPFAEDAEFGAHPDLIKKIASRCNFFNVAGQLLLPSRTLGCPDAEDPAMGPCMRQHPD